MSFTDKLKDLATDEDGVYHAADLAADGRDRGQVGTVIAVVTSASSPSSAS